MKLILNLRRDDNPRAFDLQCRVFHRWQTPSPQVRKALFHNGRLQAWRFTNLPATTWLLIAPDGSIVACRVAYNPGELKIALDRYYALKGDQRPHYEEL